MSIPFEVPPCGPIDSQIRPPGSKSITNRALICAALADGKSTLTGALHSEDTEVMVAALQQLGFDVDASWESSRVEIVGQAGAIPSQQADLHLANSGTSIRFLTALCSVGKGQFTLDGITRMRQRPISELVDALNQLGSQVVCENACPPVRMIASGLKGGSAKIKCDRSSQFLSGLLMVLPQTREFTVLQVQGKAVSLPYINMTCQVMRQFGVDVTQLSELGEYSVDPRHSYQARDYEIEPDASAASYFWAAAAITKGRCKVLGMQPDSLQGDVRFVQVLEEMGCAIIQEDDGIAIYGHDLKGIEVDMGDISDTVQTLAAVALFANGPTTITGVAHNRHKETDRIGNLAIELRKFGAEVEELDDGLKIFPPEKLQPATVETYNDHRMAMALSLVGLGLPGVIINDPGCTVKTYPNFFDDLLFACQ